MKLTETSLSHVTLKGSNFLRQRLVLSVLTGKPVTITHIRSNDTEPGLKEFEVNLLRLLDKLTNGTVLEVSETGTQLYFLPGALVGGKVHHECCPLRGIGYYLEVVFALAPFCKKQLDITLGGVTNHKLDPSVDSFKSSGLNLLRQLVVIDPGMEFQIRKRGLEPEGGGEIRFYCPSLKLKPVQKKTFGKVCKIRGTVFACRLSPAMANRFIESAKGRFLKFVPDVFLSADFSKGAACGKSPGYGGCLTAETTEGIILSADTVSPPRGQSEPVTPEELGIKAADCLLDEISRAGIVNSNFQMLAALYLAFGQKDVSQILSGPLSPYTIHFLRHLKQFSGLVFQLDPVLEGEDENLALGVNKVMMTAVGVGYNKLT